MDRPRRPSVGKYPFCFPPIPPCTFMGSPLWRNSNRDASELVISILLFFYTLVLSYFLVDAMYFLKREYEGAKGPRIRNDFIHEVSLLIYYVLRCWCEGTYIFFRTCSGLGTGAWGLVFLATKVAFSWPSVDRFGKNFGGLMTLGQVKSIQNFC